MTGSTQQKILEWLMTKSCYTDRYFTIEEIRKGIDVNYKVVWNDIFMLCRFNFLESDTILKKGFKTFRVFRYKKVLKPKQERIVMKKTQDEIELENGVEEIGMV